MVRQLTSCYDGTRRRHVRGGEGGGTRGSVDRSKQVPRVWPGERHAASTARKNGQISNWWWCVSTSEEIDLQLERCRWRSPTKFVSEQ
jgi:hypothetical protein